MARAGRSIEEIILMRKLEGVLDDKICASKTLDGRKRTDIQPMNVSGMKRNRGNSKTRACGNHDKEIIESLMEHSRLLQERVQSLESKLIMSENTTDSLKYELELSRRRIDELLFSQQCESRINSRMQTPVALSRRPLSKMESAPQHLMRSNNSTLGTLSIPKSKQKESPLKKSAYISGAQTPASLGSVNTLDIGHTVGDMEGQIVELRHLFRRVDPLEERHWASIKIQSSVRGWVIRRKYARYWAALRAWLHGRIKKYYPAVEQALLRSSYIDSGILSMKMKRDSRLVRAIFDRWQHICKQSAPFRRSMLVAAEEKFQAKIFKLKLEAFLAFKNGTIGNDSHKQIRKERRMLVERIREGIRAKMNKDGRENILISDDEVRRAVYKEIVLSSLAKKDARNRRLVFNTFKSIYTQSLRNERVAHSWRFKIYAGRCFYAWSDWTYAVGSGLERKRWAGPRRYEVRYNQKLVEHFSKVRLKKMIFRPWRRYSRTTAIVSRMFMVKQTAFMLKNVKAWREITRKHKKLRQTTISNWTGYSMYIMAPLFSAWKDFASTASIRRMHQNSLVAAYVRWKNRQKNVRILRMWRHQALYGGIEGMYSRTNISKSLGEQKSMCAALQKMITKQTVELEECKDMVQKETTNRKRMEDRVADRDVEIERLKMKNHHMDMELRRLHGVIDAMARINPRQIQHIKSMQPEFEFQERKIQPSLDVASTDDLFTADNGEVSTASQPSPSTVPETSVIEDSSSMIQDTSKQGVISRDPSGHRGTFSNINPTSSGNVSTANSVTGSVASATVLSQDDRRLLTRVKWLLRRLFEPEPEEEEEEEDDKFEAMDESETEDDGDSLSGRTPVISRGERMVQQILSDEADTKEAMFLLNMLSFLKDGNSKCLSENDSRDWAQELLASVGRNSTIVSNLLGGDDPGAKKASPDSGVDMESWRSILVHLRTNYPVGVVGTSTKIKFNDELDRPQTGVLARVRTMQTDLREVIQAKEAKIQKSRFGGNMQATLMLKSDMSSGVFTLDEDDEEDEDEGDDETRLNVYKERILGESPVEITPVVEDPGDSVYDDFDLAGDPNKPSILLSMQQSLVDSVGSVGTNSVDETAEDNGFVLKSGLSDVQ